jgi:hypothetical protein
MLNTLYVGGQNMIFKERRKKKEETDRTKKELEMINMGRIMTKKQLDEQPYNPFSINKHEETINLDDPNMTAKERKRLRDNWNQRRYYKRKKEKLRKQKEQEEAIKLFQQVMNKTVNKKEKQKKEKDDFYLK